MPAHVDAPGHNNLGLILAEHGQMTEAGKHFRQALAIEPRHADALNNLGNVLKEENRLPEGAGLFSKDARSPSTRTMPTPTCEPGQYARRLGPTWRRSRMLSPRSGDCSGPSARLVESLYPALAARRSGRRVARLRLSLDRARRRRAHAYKTTLGRYPVPRQNALGLRRTGPRRRHPLPTLFAAGQKARRHGFIRVSARPLSPLQRLAGSGPIDPGRPSSSRPRSANSAHELAGHLRHNAGHDPGPSTASASRPAPCETLAQ